MGSRWFGKHPEDRPDPYNLGRTHIALGAIAPASLRSPLGVLQPPGYLATAWPEGLDLRYQGAEDVLDAVYEAMQGHNWSPQGEARAMIEGLGLEHTSMSVGDVIQDVRGPGRAFMVDRPVGFYELPRGRMAVAIEDERAQENPCGPRHPAYRKRGRGDPERNPSVYGVQRGLPPHPPEGPEWVVVSYHGMPVAHAYTNAGAAVLAAAYGLADRVGPEAATRHIEGAGDWAGSTARTTRARRATEGES